MKNEPIHEIKFLKFLTKKLSEEVSASSSLLTGDQLDALFAGIDKLHDKLEQIEESANVFHSQYGSAIAI